MINYGVVYPQAILIFTVTMLYSIVVPPIVIFGAVYFGIAYVVYKYKLLFGAQFPLSSLFTLHDAFLCRSILQTLRVSRASLAHHFRTVDMGRDHFSCLHDRYLHSEEVLCPVISLCPAPCGYGGVVLVCRQVTQAVKRICVFELGVRGAER